MRKIISYLHASLDGFVQGTNDWDLNWISYDAALENYAKEITSTADTVLWGRVTYLGMQSFWPTVPANPESTKQTVAFSHWIDKVEKIVFSKTLEHVTWNNTRLIKDNIAEEVSGLKAQPGNDIMMMGSPGLVHSLLEHRLIDELRVNVNPILLGSGVPFLKNIKDRTKLDLIAAKTFQSGVVGLHYATRRT
jgi:dihydrofolate reductase